MEESLKQLLLKDLSARLPYGVCVEIDCEFIENGRHIVRLCEVNASGILKNIEALNVKPYLRPMSSMTEDEKNELGALSCEGNILHTYGVFYRCQDWLNAHHFDYRKSYDLDRKEWLSMIERGLAVEVLKIIILIKVKTKLYEDKKVVSFKSISKGLYY